DLAAELVGLLGRCPLIASGRLAWLAVRRSRTIPEYVKPSPVHALAAIGAAVSGSECAALDAAAELIETGALTGPLADLRGDWKFRPKASRSFALTAPTRHRIRWSISGIQNIRS